MKPSEKDRQKAHSQRQEACAHSQTPSEVPQRVWFVVLVNYKEISAVFLSQLVAILTLLGTFEHPHHHGLSDDVAIHGFE